MSWTGLTLKVLERALDASAFRHKLLANNIANADTPGYKRKDLAFQQELERIINTMLAEEEKVSPERPEMVRTHPGHRGKGTDSFRPVIRSSDRQIFRNDGNNVDIEREMSELAKNNLYYQVVADQLHRQLHRIEKVIAQAGQK